MKLRIRTVLLLAILLILCPFAMEARYPTLAPQAVQDEGRTFAQVTLERLLPTPFGRSTRGQALIHTARETLNEKRVFFSAALGGPRGQSIVRLFGRRRIYLKVIQVNDEVYLHQRDWQLAEALIHESVHARVGGIRTASFEEECDAFAAGLQAEAAIRKVTPTTPLTIDRLPIAEFIRRQYPRIKSRPDYQPVAITREELGRLAGF